MSEIKSKKIRIAFFAALAALIFAAPLAAQVRGWGQNDSGQLGIGSAGTTEPSPVSLTNSNEITAISGGEAFTLFLKAAGTVLTAGTNLNGQIGDGTTAVARISPVPALNLTNVVAVSAGQLHALALRADGTVWAWGRFSEGQLGGGGSGCGVFITSGCNIPAPIPGLTNVVAVDGGGLFSLALKADGTVWAWGTNSNGQLGNGTTNPSGQPVQVGVGVAGFDNIVAVSAGQTHSVALKADGTVWVWGSNLNGSVGNGTNGGNQLLPVLNTTLFGVSAIGAGFNSSVALKPDGTVFAWGLNVRGEMGNGTVSTVQNSPCQCVSTPVQSTITNVVEVKTANASILAKKRDGTIWAWGWNQLGELGIGTTDTLGCQCRPLPVQSSVGTGNPVFGIGYDHGHVAVPAAATPAGANVALTADGVSVAFDSVTGAGTTVLTALDPNSTGLNSGSFIVLANSPAYNVTTTAAFSGNVRVCLKTPTVFDQTVFNGLSILHGEGGNLVNRTFSRNYATREICAQTTSLSPFVLAQSPTAAPVFVAGRVVAPGGGGIANVAVSLVDTVNGETFRTRSNAFGNYRFEAVPAGRSYLLTVSSRRFSFAADTRLIEVFEDFTAADFVAADAR
ncbi:MAG: carboxypeptidase regulatory-like domain-containing protein [Acidobacteria bacterium]|nr:carboxypeptidase regulatory-like domain-containing protein [Acidobacteriota bacterium]